MMSEKDIAERLRDAYTRTGGNSVGDPFVSQIAREIASVASDRTHIGTLSAYDAAGFAAPADDLAALRAEVERLREVSKDTLAHLVAATSLLKAGGKKAAPSDKMFDQMVRDYEASIERARTALKEGGDHDR